MQWNNVEINLKQRNSLSTK